MLNFSEVETPPDEKAIDHIKMRVKPSDRERMSRAAERILREHQTTVLSERDSQAVLKALDNPPAPTLAARDAVHNYRSRIVNAG